MIFEMRFLQWACFQGREHGYFEDIHIVTMFADYRVPQTLVHFGCLEYDDYLTNLLNSSMRRFWLSKSLYLMRLLFVLVLDKVLDCGCAEEVEIRGASIFVVEELKRHVLAELKEQYPAVPTQNVNSILLDHFLWDYRRRYADELEYIPFHKTIGIYY